MPYKNLLSATDTLPSVVAAPSSITIAATSQRTFPDLWLRRFILDIGTGVAETQSTFELLPYNSSADDILAEAAVQNLTIPMGLQAMRDLPEAVTAYRSAVNLVGPLRDWAYPAVFVDASTDPSYINVAGYYFRYGQVNNRPAYYKKGTTRTTKIVYSSQYDHWEIIGNSVQQTPTLVWFNVHGEENPTPSQPWQVAAGDWEPAESDPFLTVTQVTYP